MLPICCSYKMIDRQSLSLRYAEPAPFAGGSLQTNLSLLCVKGGGAALAVTEELSVHTVDFNIIQNDR